MFVVVGLGNPGITYDRTYHNVGFEVIKKLLERHPAISEGKKCKAIIAETRISDKRCALCMPQTYMNLSGESVVPLVNWYKPEREELIVVYDDVDLPLGKLRFRANGSAGTHNGMRNIVEQLGDGDFPRLRVGIGRPPEYMDLKDYVLKRLSGDDSKVLDEAFLKAAEAIEIYITEGLEKVRTFVGK